MGFQADKEFRSLSHSSSVPLPFFLCTACPFGASVFPGLAPGSFDPALESLTREHDICVAIHDIEKYPDHSIAIDILKKY